MEFPQPTYSATEQTSLRQQHRRGLRLAEDVGARRQEALARHRIVDAALDLVLLWKAQRIANLPRADRNVAIEETRERLIRAVEAYDDRLEESGAATA